MGLETGDELVAEDVLTDGHEESTTLCDGLVFVHLHVLDSLGNLPMFEQRQ